ncbi:MAG: radical SAM protein [Treponema sp.]|jgi:radical SAM protein with 4Fe4S-binding SPASM domain|nr:radical SAM protein [Treponema sp.]
MTYQLETFIWELTMGCNLRCLHCGSSCAERLPGELSLEESLRFAREVASLKPHWASLSGGEPLLRNDWHLIAQTLAEGNILVGMITNGLLVNREIAYKMRQCGLKIVSISLDGTRDIHNRMRGGDYYDQAVRGYRWLKQEGIHCGSNTTVIKENIDDLPNIRDELLRLGVGSWQIQLGLPSGRLAKNIDFVLLPEAVERLIDFVYEENRKGDMRVFLAESAGYFTRKETFSHQKAMPTNDMVVWNGCNAGIRSFGLLHNGDVVGCTSLRDARFIEGNLRTRSIVDIWQDPYTFAWRRNLKAAQLGGICKDCVYVEDCLGGCTNSRFTMTGDIYSGNEYCAYALARKKQAVPQELRGAAQ